MIVDTDKANQNEGKKEIVFKYPKSKIFVGGLDFRLTNEELKQHFSEFGEIDSAVILKDINTGQSRGFGFVTFKDEAVAQDLIINMQVTTINGRKVDIKSAEPKQKDSSQPAPVIPRKFNNQFPAVAGFNQPAYAMIPQYGEPYRATKKDESAESPTSSSKDKRRDDHRHRSRRDESAERHRSRRHRSDSYDSRDSSHSYSRNKDRKRSDKEKRAPHYQEKARGKGRSRSRSRS